MRRPILLVGSCLLLVACGDKGAGSGSASAQAAPPASASAPAPASGPKALAICDTQTTDEHACFEFSDEEIVAERARVCPGGVVRDAACPVTDRIAACRLPDGSVRYGYPPRTVLQHEKHCREAKGKFSPSADAPPPDRKVVLSCRGKLKGACEEEETYTLQRLNQANEDCATFGGLFASGDPCPRDRAISTCDLEGKRTIVFYPEGELEEPSERQTFCEERRGKYVELTPAPSASASPSAPPPSRE
ncbi:MAG: hypothetical protein JNL21_18125 [Myxococcales bacterium]|nr:hypothetical protein [Myxococcales bacterium]